MLGRSSGTGARSRSSRFFEAARWRILGLRKVLSKSRFRPAGVCSGEPRGNVEAKLDVDVVVGVVLIARTSP